MAKIFDITDKLNFEENPRLNVNGTELEVKTDAESVLLLMNAISEANTDAGAINVLCESVFTKASQKKLKEMKLNFHDYSTVVHAALDVAIGKDPGTEAKEGNA